MIDSAEQKFKDKTLLITGGTGSFGNAVLKRFIDTDIAEIRIFSRDEKKQDDMRRLYQNPKINYILGDVRNPNDISRAMEGVDYCFHAAALKQVPSCEFYPIQAARTNIDGTFNTAKAASDNNIEKMIFLSTDKAVYPINAMGMSKAMGEKVIRAQSNASENTLYNITRYGNVMASRGSVIPLFVKQAKAGDDLTVTNPDMTRFLMSLDEAVDLVIYSFLNGGRGDTFIQKAPSSTVADLAAAIIELFGSKSKLKILGTRHGEKKHETLLTREEFATAEDLGKYYRIPIDERSLNYDNFLTNGTEELDNDYEYSSANTTRLDIPQIIDKLLETDYIKYQLSGEHEEKGLV